MSDLDPIIHQPARLRIMAALMALGAQGEIEFATLARLLKLTDGNLGAHLATLEEAGYLKAEKLFVARKPRTRLRATHKGRTKFHEHVETLREIIQGSGGGNLAD